MALNFHAMMAAERAKAKASNATTTASTSTTQSTTMSTTSTSTTQSTTAERADVVAERRLLLLINESLVRRVVPECGDDLPAVPAFLEAHRCGVGVVESVFYVPDFLSEQVADELESQLDQAIVASAMSWNRIRGREVAMLGGVVTPSGMLREPLPACLQPALEPLASMWGGEFRANHVLVNRFVRSLRVAGGASCLIRCTHFFNQI